MRFLIKHGVCVKLIKYVVIWMIVLFFAPYILAFVAYKTFKKKRFLIMLFSVLPDDIRTREIDKIRGVEEGEFDEALATSLYDLKDENYWLSLGIDWSAIDEVEPQANSQIKHYGIKDTFTLNSSHEYESVWQALVAYDVWLKARGYEFVLWDQGSDEYTGFICDSRIYSNFLKLGNKVGLNLVRLDHENEQ